MEYWRLGVTSFEYYFQIKDWVNAILPWKSVEEAKQVSDSKLDEEVKLEELAKSKAELEQLERRRLSTENSLDGSSKALHLKACEKYEELSGFVRHTLTKLQAAEIEFSQLMDINMTSATVNTSNLDVSRFCGPESGRDSFYALAWLEVYHNDPSSFAPLVDMLGELRKHHSSIVMEIYCLRRMELAAKVVCHVTSPHQKKLLNLSYNWLNTFLPHCLAKVNRVSFGLLSLEDCEAAIKADPMVPRSRLKLAVPFVGKDVPSSASEFAHPDIIIGLSILAYRYSGLRDDDYKDVIDRLTAQFSNEIGPARDRASSLRHEKWVWSAGGRIRGLNSTRDGLPWIEHGGISEEQSEKEVVQLKFLQKSNKDQMDRLYNLIKLEPSVVHHYLQSMIFPQYMRSQREKISASGQTVGGDMLVMKRVGFSGTPSDLLPQELGRCDYETGDDGMMLLTCLDRSVTSYEYIKDQWNVENVLDRIAKSESPRYHALIDTGALITGYSNYEVAKQLLDRGLAWCDGVVFLDGDDKQQVLVRATGRVVSTEQCGVSLEKRFAFYDQIHTTGMDIKHVVNATACITLGKDMVFRDFVQGAYRMRGIGIGQKIHVYIIPEVQEIMNRELKNVEIPVLGREDITSDHVLEDIVAWLIINSLRSEQTQWTMLCIQNIGNLYRKNAFKSLRQGFADSLFKNHTTTESVSTSNASDFIDRLDKNQCLELFSESIDFSLESGVPDPLPFQDKLQLMLDRHESFMLPEQHEVGRSIMEITGQFSMIESSGGSHRLDTEQEREQEQEQEKEVEQRRDQQVEVEKFIEREYSRQEEKQRPWPFKMLAQKRMQQEDHPFYPLSNFSLKQHDSLSFPKALYASTNFYNPKWTGLRRVKNVIMLLEYAPSTDIEDLRLRRPDEVVDTLTESQHAALLQAHNLFGFKARASGQAGLVTRDDLKNVILSVTDQQPSEMLLDSVIQHFRASDSMAAEDCLTFEEFTSLLTSHYLMPEHVGRHWVAVSLAEAETIRRIVHVRKNKSNALIKDASTECALRFLQMSDPSAPPCGDGGVIFDASHKWSASSNRGHAETGATCFEAAVAHNNFRFFDADMFYSSSSLNMLLRSLGGTTKERENYFLSMIGVKRRMERKWQEAPIAKIFTVPDQFAALRHQALAVFIVEALKARGLTIWEAFTAFDSDNNGLLSPAEFYGALIWLQVPDITATDVVDYLEVVDRGRDGHIDYPEFVDFLSISSSNPAVSEVDDDDVVDHPGSTALAGRLDLLKSGERLQIKVEPHGADELREIILRRKQEQQLQLRDDRLRKLAFNDALDTKIFDDELEASKLRKGGQNPTVAIYQDLSSFLYASSDSSKDDGNVAAPSSIVVTDFNFAACSLPLRCVVSGTSSFIPIFFGTKAAKPVHLITCIRKHAQDKITACRGVCKTCSKKNVGGARCSLCKRGFHCGNCQEADLKRQDNEARNPKVNPTFLRLEKSCSFTLQIPPRGLSAIDDVSGDFTVSLDLRFVQLPFLVDLQSLLQFSSTLPSNSSQENASTTRTCVYVNNLGLVFGRRIKSNGESLKEKKETNEMKVANATQTGRLVSNKWSVVTICVQPSQGRLTTYVDGRLSSISVDLLPSELRLHHRIVVGGSKQASVCAGHVRRIVIYNTSLQEEHVKQLRYTLADKNPATGGLWVKVQARIRGLLVRKKPRPVLG